MRSIPRHPRVVSLVLRCRGINRACSELLFCIGLVLLLALLAADTSVWLGCRHLSRADCVDLFALSFVQTGMEF